MRSACQGSATVRFLTALGLCVLAGASFAQWQGSVTVDAVSQDADDSTESFRTQYDLDDGIGLGRLDLSYRAEAGAELELTAHGFGAIEPAAGLRLRYRDPRAFDLLLDYDRRESFFSLASFEDGHRRDDWRIERWRARGEYDGFDFADLAIELRHGSREGETDRPFFGLNDLYLRRTILDETFREVAFEVDRTDGRLRLIFEQRFAEHDYDNAWQAVETNSLLAADEEPFTEAGRTIAESVDVPTTRIVASWAGERERLACVVIYSPAEVEGSGLAATRFDLGELGSIEWRDLPAFSADRDRLAAVADGTFALGQRFAFHARVDRRDSDTDGVLALDRVLRVMNPVTGTTDIADTVGAVTRYDVSDTDVRAELRYRHDDWQFWAGGTTTSRDVDGLGDFDGAPLDRERDRDGFVLGARGRWNGWDGHIEFESNDFDDSIFRTDPQDADRLSLRLRGRLGAGWSVNAYARILDAENPDAVSGLDQSSEALGLGASWASDDGKAGLGASIDRLDLESDTDLVLPSGEAGLSRYDLELLTLTFHGRREWDRWSLAGAVTRVDDGGESWPLDSWTASVRTDYHLGERWSIGAFANYWSYDEDRSDLDDYTATRIGARLTWRLP